MCAVMCGVGRNLTYSLRGPGSCLSVAKLVSHGGGTSGTKCECRSCATWQTMQGSAKY